MAVPITAREPVEFTPRSLPKKFLNAEGNPLAGEDGKPKVRILVRVPTMMERDTYSAALIRGGVISYTRSQIRDMALAGVQELFPKDTHEDKQALLREVWQTADDEARYELDEIEALRELAEAAEAAGKKKISEKDLKERLGKIPPAAVMDPGRRIEATSLNQEIMSRFKPLNQALASLTEQDAKRGWLNAEVYVIGWEGLEDSPEGNSRGGLQQHEIEYLRRVIGEEAFRQLSDFITGMQTIDEDEEKNLASLLESMSAQIGSTPSKSKASSESGNSTGEPSTSIPEDGSPKTTASSSSSTTSSRTKKAASRKGGRTAAP